MFLIFLMNSTRCLLEFPQDLHGIFIGCSPDFRGFSQISINFPKKLARDFMDFFVRLQSAYRLPRNFQGQTKISLHFYIVILAFVNQIAINSQHDSHGFSRDFQRISTDFHWISDNSNNRFPRKFHWISIDFPGIPKKSLDLCRFPRNSTGRHRIATNLNSMNNMRGRHKMSK